MGRKIINNTKCEKNKQKIKNSKTINRKPKKKKQKQKV